MRRLTSLAACSLLLAALLPAWLARAQSPPCDEASYASLEQVLSEIETEEPQPQLQLLGPDGETAPAEAPPEPFQQTFEFTAGAVAETCSLADALERTLDDVGMVAPEQQSRIVLRGLTSDLTLLLGICDGSTVALIDRAAQLAPPEREAAFVDGCATARELAPREALVAVSFPRLLAATVLFGHLQGRGEPHAQELARFLLGHGLTTWTAP